MPCRLVGLSLVLSASASKLTTTERSFNSVLSGFVWPVVVLAEAERCL